MDEDLSAKLVFVAPDLLRFEETAGGAGGSPFDDFAELRQQILRSAGESSPCGSSPSSSISSSSSTRPPSELFCSYRLARVVICPYQDTVGSIRTTFQLQTPARGHTAGARGKVQPLPPDPTLCRAGPTSSSGARPSAGLEDALSFSRGGLDPNDCGIPGDDVILAQDDVIVEVLGVWGSSWLVHPNLIVDHLGLRVLSLRAEGQLRGYQAGCDVGGFSRRYRGRAFVIRAPPGFCIAGFHGRAGWFLDNLGVYFRRFLFWSEGTHHLFPKAFKQEAQALLLAWRLAPPGVPLASLSWAEVSCVLCQLAERHLLPHGRPVTPEDVLSAGIVKPLFMSWDA